MSTFPVSELPTMIKAAKRKVFVMQFIKSDGTLRNMIGTTEWPEEPKKEGTKPAPYKPAEKGITIFMDVELEKKGEHRPLRAVKWDSIQNIKMDDVVYIKKDDGLFHAKNKKGK